MCGSADKVHYADEVCCAEEDFKFPLSGSLHSTLKYFIANILVLNHEYLFFEITLRHVVGAYDIIYNILIIDNAHHSSIKNYSESLGA